MNRAVAVTSLRRVLAFVVVALPLVITAATPPGESFDGFGWRRLALWPGLLAAGLLGGVLVHGRSGAAIEAAGVAAGVLVFALAAWSADPMLWYDDPLLLFFGLGSGCLAIALIGYGIARSVARAVGDGGRVPRISPGRLLIVVGALAWLLAQLLPAWTYHPPLGDTVTDPGVLFTFFPLSYLAEPGYWLAWPANLLLAAAWGLAVRRSSYEPPAWLAVSAFLCAIGGVAIQLAEGSYQQVVEIGTVVWCGSFATLALGFAIRDAERRPGVLAPPA